jgi:hypothetical protein
VIGHARDGARDGLGDGVGGDGVRRRRLTQPVRQEAGMRCAKCSPSPPRAPAARGSVSRYQCVPGLGPSRDRVAGSRGQHAAGAPVAGDVRRVCTGLNGRPISGADGSMHLGPVGPDAIEPAVATKSRHSGAPLLGARGVRADDLRPSVLGGSSSVWCSAGRLDVIRGRASLGGAHRVLTGRG